jgi:hypothetical protein
MLHRTKHVRLALTFMFLAMVICAPAAFGQAVTQDTPIPNQLITNECNGEPVLLNGTLHSEMSFSTNPNGMTHYSLNSTAHMTGVGQITGVNYVANDTTHMETNTRGFAQEQSVNTKIKLISQGPQTPNMMDHATLHVVIDSNGVPKIEISKHKIQCN